MHDCLDVTINEMQHKSFDRNLMFHASVLTALIFAFLFELYAFAQVQDIWLDESTQLSGITLKPWEILRWLAGVDLDRFGVPGDRMPPVSHLLDWLWLHLSGPSELGFRLFHSAFVIGGVTGLAIFTWHKVGPSAATVSLAFLVLSPKLIQTGVEIRAYPIFFAVTCAQVIMFVQLVANPKKVSLKLLAAFALICVTATYTHFYGLISSCAFFFALGIAFIRSFTVFIALIAAFVIVIIGSSGILFFVSSAIMYSATENVNETGRYSVYLLKLFGDSANMVSVSAALLFFAGTLALFIAGMITAFVRVRNGNLRSFDWLFAVVIAAVFATIMASLFIKTFDVLKASYSGWLFAPLSVIIGIGATSSTGFYLWDRAGRILAVGTMLIGGGLSTYLFLVHASMFVHGPERFVGALYNGIAGPKAIVYETGSAWEFSYYPLVFSHKGEIVQYHGPENGVGLISENRVTQPSAREVEAKVAPYRFLLLVNIHLRTYRDLRQCQYQLSACPDFALGAIEGMLTGTGQWRELKVERSFGLFDTQVKILERGK
jgi:hypothetical protein